MNWKEFWQEQASKKNAQERVGRINANSQKANAASFLHTVQHIKTQLSLQQEHSLLDVCCGNGQLAVHLAPDVKQYFGLDFTLPLIEEAKQLPLQNAEFLWGDASKLITHVPSPVDRILLHFSLQYFEDAKQRYELFNGLFQVSKPGARVLISDIPDASRWKAFYKSPLQRLRYLKQKLMGNEDMGAWFKPAQLARYAQGFGFEVSILEQPSHLPYSHYRFDILLIKPLP